MKQDYVVTTSP